MSDAVLAQLARTVAIVARRTGIDLRLAVTPTGQPFVYVGHPEQRVSPAMPPAALLLWVDAFAEGHAFAHLARPVATARPRKVPAKPAAPRRLPAPPLARVPRKPAKRTTPRQTTPPPARGLWLVPKPKARR